MISGETTIRIGHGEVFLKESYLRILWKCLEDISDGVYCYLTWMSFTRFLIDSAENPKSFKTWKFFRKIFDKSRLKVGRIKKSEFQKLYVWRCMLYVCMFDVVCCMFDNKTNCLIFAMFGKISHLNVVSDHFHKLQRIVILWWVGQRTGNF